MTPAAIIRQATADGVSLALCPAGTIKATGKQAAVYRWLSTIREYKPAIVAALVDAANEADAFDCEAFEERAAIIEFDGGLIRAEAERIATELIRSMRLERTVGKEIGHGK